MLSFGKELNLTEFSLDDLIPDVRVIASSLAVQWPGIEAEDIEQEMSTRLALRWSDLEALDRRMILGFAKREGTAYCARERDYYQRQTAEWIYTPREVRELLASMFTTPLDTDTPKRPSKGAEHVTADGVSVLLMDIRRAFEAVSESDQAAIMSAFGEGEKPRDGAGKKRLERAVLSATDRLNRGMAWREVDRMNHDGPGSRRVVNNTTARVVTGNHY